MPGYHNIQNAVAAITVGLQMAMKEDEVRLVFATFAGVKRRCTGGGEALGMTSIES